MEANETEAQAQARVLLEPGLRHGALALVFGAPVYGGGQDAPALEEILRQLRKTMDKAEAGDTSTATRMLAAQAAALDGMFTELCRRAQLNANDFPEAAEKYIRLALKAQARCASTLEALAGIQRPMNEAPRHVTVADGGQAIIADQFHHHAGASQNEKTAGQCHAASGEPGARPAMPGPDEIRWAVPGSGGEGAEKVPNARRHKPRSPKG